MISPSYVLTRPAGVDTKKKHIIYGAFAESVPLKIDWSGTIEKRTALNSFYHSSKDKKLNHILLHMCVN